jgi:hypothetical protein
MQRLRPSHIRDTHSVVEDGTPSCSTLFLSHPTVTLVSISFLLHLVLPLCSPRPIILPLHYANPPQSPLTSTCILSRTRSKSEGKSDSEQGNEGRATKSKCQSAGLRQSETSTVVPERRNE